MSETPRTHPSGHLLVVGADGEPLVHLAAAVGAQTLCGLTASTRPHGESLRATGCSPCQSAAREQGHTCALDGARAWINLTRLQVPSV